MSEEEKKNKTTRRAFMAGSTGFAAGLALGSTGLTKLVEASETETQEEKTFSYEPVDAEKWAEKALENYYEYACAEGTFITLVNSQVEAGQEAFESVPSGIFGLASGGGVGWGTICGAPNGALGFLSLVEEGTGDLANEVLAWYSQEELPLEKFNDLGDYNDIPSSQAGSPLCHASVSNWLEESGKKDSDPERAERCGKLVASTVYKVIKMLNAKVEGTFEREFKAGNEQQICMSCHGSNWLDDTLGKMNCVECHDSSQVHEGLFTTN